MAAPELASTFVPRRRRTVVAIDAGDERVLLDRTTGELHRLNATGGLVWDLFDGSASAAEVADELSAASGVDAATVRADVVALVRTLMQAGLLEASTADVAPDEPGATGDRGDRGPDVDGPDHRRARLVAEPDEWLDGQLRAEQSQVIELRRPDVELAIGLDDADVARQLAHGLARFGPVTTRPRSLTGIAAPLYTVVVARPTDDDPPRRGLHLLYREGQRVRRCRETDELVRVILADVAAVVTREHDPTAALTGVALIRDQAGVVVDAAFSSMVDNLERRLQRDGVVRLDAPFHAVEITGTTPRVDTPDGSVRLAALFTRRTGRDESTAGAFVVAQASFAAGIGGRLDPESLGLIARLPTTDVAIQGVDNVRQLMAMVREALSVPAQKGPFDSA